MNAPAPLRVRLAPGPRSLLDDLMYLRRRYRRVVPSTDYLAERHGVDRSTIKRWLAALRDAGQLVSVYNGGQGRRCIYYLGPRAVEEAIADNPEWNVKAGEKSVFGALRMGRVARARRTALDLKNEILKPLGSSSTERGTPSESPPSEIQAPIGEALPVRDAPPHGPPAGGPLPAQGDATPHEHAGDGTSPPAELEPAQERLRRPVPLPPAADSPEGSEAQKKRPRGELPRPARRSLAHDRWDLWCRAWKLWRAYHRKAKGDYVDHPTDVGAMKSLMLAALMASRRDELAALDHLAWGFREYLRDPRQSFKPLARLARTRAEYGRPPEGFQAPFRPEGVAADLARGTPKRLERLAGGVGAGGRAAPPAPRPSPPLKSAVMDNPRSVLELARIALERAEQAAKAGFGSRRAVERARRLVEELEAKERDR